MCFAWIVEQTAIISVYNINISALKPRQRVSTARYELGLYIRQIQPTGHVMHQQCNIQELYTLPTLYLRVLYLSENKQRLVPLTA